MMFRLFFLIASAAALAFPVSVMAENTPKTTLKTTAPKPAVNTAPTVPTVPAAAPVVAVPAPAATPACPSTEDLESKHLLGTWRVTQPQHPEVSALLEFEPHPEHEDSLRGVLRPSQGEVSLTVLLVGDIDDGELVMDESLDSQHISAIWTVRPVPDSCGRKWEGERRAAGEDSTEALVMSFVAARPASLPKITPSSANSTSAAPSTTKSPTQRPPKTRPATGL